MNLNTLSIIACIIGVIMLVTFIIAHRKNQKSIGIWSAIIVLFLVSLISSYFATDLSLQWVLIESSTLFGAILISSSQTAKSSRAAWKFLLINSFGLGVAFLGLLLVSYGIHITVSMQYEDLVKHAAESHNILLYVGLWLAIFGYSAKLGLFPNMFWVGDTYADSPSLISSFIAAYVPTAVCLALKPLITLDKMVSKTAVNATNFLLFLGIVTIIYSIISLYRTEDIRRISAKIALFHSGSLAVLLWLQPKDEILYYFLVVTIIIKTFLFLSLGILRMESESRNLSTIFKQKSISRVTTILFIFSVCSAFTLPISPVILGDIMLIQLGITSSKPWIISIPILGIIFFGIVIMKILPLLNIPNRDFDPNYQNITRFRLIVTAVVFAIALWASYSGLILLTKGA